MKSAHKYQKMQTFFLSLFYCVCGFEFVYGDTDRILDYKFEKNSAGPYTYRFLTSQGFKREETAERLFEGTEFETLFLHGSYQYYGADGKLYIIKYRADENGFHPEGPHIQVPPYVPWPSKIKLTYKNKKTETILPQNKEHDLILFMDNSIKSFRTTTELPLFLNSLKNNKHKASRKLPASEISPNFPSLLSSTFKSTNTETTPSEEYRFDSSKDEMVPRKRFEPMKTIHIATSTLPPRIFGKFMESRNKIKFFSQRLTGVFTSPEPPRKDPNFIPGVTNRYIPSSSESPRKYEEEHIILNNQDLDKLNRDIKSTYRNRRFRISRRHDELE